jgi:hypothetical protein
MIGMKTIFFLAVLLTAPKVLAQSDPSPVLNAETATNTYLQAKQSVLQVLIATPAYQKAIADLTNAIAQNAAPDVLLALRSKLTQMEVAVTAASHDIAEARQAMIAANQYANAIAQTNQPVAPSQPIVEDVAPTYNDAAYADEEAPIIGNYLPYNQCQTIGSLGEFVAQYGGGRYCPQNHYRTPVCAQQPVFSRSALFAPTFMQCHNSALVFPPSKKQQGTTKIASRK